MKKLIMILTFIVCCIGLSGCKNAAINSQTDGITYTYIAYTDIDTVCDNYELTEIGAGLLSSMEESLLLSFVVDSSIDITEELGDYDHLILTNPQWIEQFGDTANLKPVEYDSLSHSMQEFLDAQMPIWTVDESVLPDGISLYQYENENLMAFPVNVTLGMTKPVEAKNPLIILVDKPAQTLKAGSCTLPLTSSGNILFTDENKLQTLFEESELNAYGRIEVYELPF